MHIHVASCIVYVVQHSIKDEILSINFKDLAIVVCCASIRMIKHTNVYIRKKIYLKLKKNFLLDSGAISC